MLDMGQCEQGGGVSESHIVYGNRVMRIAYDLVLHNRQDEGETCNVLGALQNGHVKLEYLSFLNLSAYSSIKDSRGKEVSSGGIVKEDNILSEEDNTRHQLQLIQEYALLSFYLS